MKVSLGLCTCLLALQLPWLGRAIPEEKSSKATHCAVELLPLIDVVHRSPSQ